MGHKPMQPKKATGAGDVGRPRFSCTASDVVCAAVPGSALSFRPWVSALILPHPQGVGVPHATCCDKSVRRLLFQPLRGACVAWRHGEQLCSLFSYHSKTRNIKATTKRLLSVSLRDSKHTALSCSRPLTGLHNLSPYKPETLSPLARTPRGPLPAPRSVSVHPATPGPPVNGIMHACPPNGARGQGLSACSAGR